MENLTIHTDKNQQIRDKQSSQPLDLRPDLTGWKKDEALLKQYGIQKTDLSAVAYSAAFGGPHIQVDERAVRAKVVSQIVPEAYPKKQQSSETSAPVPSRQQLETMRITHSATLNSLLENLSYVGESGEWDWNSTNLINTIVTVLYNETLYLYGHIAPSEQWIAITDDLSRLGYSNVFGNVLGKLILCLLNGHEYHKHLLKIVEYLQIQKTAPYSFIKYNPSARKPKSPISISLAWNYRSANKTSVFTSQAQIPHDSHPEKSRVTSSIITVSPVKSVSAVDGISNNPGARTTTNNVIDFPATSSMATPQAA